MHTTTPRTLVWTLATTLLLALAPAGPLAATGNEQACTVHEPIRILEDHGPLGFTWDDPLTGETTYRPGSGVVAGDGTAANPYEIAGWCIAGSKWDPNSIEIIVCDFGHDGPEPEETGVLICGTSAHFVFHNNTINLWKHGTAIGNVSPDTATLEHTDHLNNTHQVRVNDAPGISIRHNLIHGMDATELVWSLRAIQGSSDDAAIEHNRIVVAERLIDLGGDDVRIAHNELVSGSKAHVSAWGDGLEVVDNTAESRHFATPTNWGLQVSGTNLRVENNTIDVYEWAGIDLWADSAEIAHNKLTTTESATGILASGTDVRIHNTTVDGGFSGISTGGNTDGALLENVTVTSAETAFDVYKSNDTTWRYNDVSGYTDAGMTVELAGNTTVRQTNFADTGGIALEVVDADDTVDAKHNWWGCADGPDDGACDDVVGDAVYEPWLTKENKGAGAAN